MVRYSREPHSSRDKVQKEKESFKILSYYCVEAWGYIVCTIPLPVGGVQKTVFGPQFYFCIM